VEIPPGMGGLRTRSKIMVNQTRAVDKIRLIKKLGNLSEELMDRVNQALKLNYDLE
jgi:mRNA interferase MazF